MSEALVSQYQNTLGSFADHLIEQDRALHYEQAVGMNITLHIISHTGIFNDFLSSSFNLIKFDMNSFFLLGMLSRIIRDFVKKFNKQLAGIFSNAGRYGRSVFLQTNQRCLYKTFIFKISPHLATGKSNENAMF